MSSRRECLGRCEIQSDTTGRHCQLFNYRQDKKLCELSFCSSTSQGEGHPPLKKKRSLGIYTTGSPSPTYSAWETYLRVQQSGEDLDKIDYRGNPNPRQNINNNVNDEKR